MPEIPDLSKLKNGQQPEPDKPAAEPRIFRTAFIVLIDAAGNIQVSIDVPDDYKVDHPPSHDEIWTACQLIGKDIQVQQTAGLVQAGLLQMGSAMQQQAMNEQIRSRLNLK